MRLLAHTLKLNNFRNILEGEIELSSGTSIFLGHNAVGKTNCIEALQLLTTGSSFKNPSANELMHNGEINSKISLLMRGEKREIETSLEVVEGKKDFYLNSKHKSAKEIRGYLPSVLFYPDDLRLIKNSARYRRDELDSFGIQITDRYWSLKNNFERTLTQRNTLLKEGFTSGDVFDAWDENYIAHCALFYLYRSSLINRIAPKIEAAYKMISPDENLYIRYIPSWVEFDKNKQVHTPFSNIKIVREELVEHIKNEVCSAQEIDEYRCTTTIGPHRDEVAFYIDGKNARLYGSQGQQRSIVLAWKIAEVDLIKEIVGYYPILLLDDVMSELDKDRRQSLISLMKNGVQTVITTTNLQYFTDDILDTSKVIEVEDVAQIS